MPRVAPAILLSLASLCAAVAAAAQTDEAPSVVARIDAAPDRAVRVGVVPAPPYATRTSGGTHLGLAVDVWRIAAEGAGLDYDLVALDRGAVEAALREGRVDVALPVVATPARESALDLTHPLHTATMGIAAEPGSRVAAVVRGFLSLDFLRVVAGLSALLLAVGAVIWLLERRRNAQMFARSPLRGLGDGFWWAGVTLTTIGYGDKAPVTFAGRSVAMLWMLVGLAVSSILTATVVNLSDLERTPDIPESLAGLTVGVVRGSTAELFLSGRNDVTLRRHDTLGAALSALQSGAVARVAGAAPRLRSLVDSTGGFDMQVRNTRLDPHYVAMALPPGSDLREPLNAQILAVVTSESGWELTQRYLPD